MKHGGLVVTIAILVVAAVSLVLLLPLIQIRLVERQLRAEMHTLLRLAQEPKHWSDCQVDQDQQFFDKDKSPLLAYQLRFTSKHAYVLEANCRETSLKPIVLETKTLPYGAEKTSGSGIIVPFESATTDALIVVVLGQKRLAVGIVNGGVSSRMLDPKELIEPIGNQVVTSCEGWGGQCCSSVTQVGAVTVPYQVTDCRGQCFASCQERPQVVLFNTNPPLDNRTRTIMLSHSRSSLVVSYRLNDLDGKVVEAQLDWGDGTVATDLADQAVLDHSYDCDWPECMYTIRLQATDNQGNGLAQGRLETVSVVVRD